MKSMRLGLQRAAGGSGYRGTSSFHFSHCKKRNDGKTKLTYDTLGEKDEYHRPKPNYITFLW